MGATERPPPLEDLDARLKKARATQQPQQRAPLVTSGMAQALRVALEMASALAVGGAIGWFLDRWLGTRPWLLLGFLLLGVAAGILNAYRAAMRMSAEANKDEAPDDRSG
jgi:ATP synthase protein I